uniref:V1 protein n=1 Tax=Grapevine red blotch virus TaxID=1381007 RepID=A0A7S6SMS1_9GEMI|nr:V1 protein [Grapevine red blotch virus]
MVLKKRSRQRKQRRRRRTTGRSSAVRRRVRPRSRPCQFAFHGNSFGGTPSLFFFDSYCFRYWCGRQNRSSIDCQQYVFERCCASDGKCHRWFA